MSGPSLCRPLCSGNCSSKGMSHGANLQRHPGLFFFFSLASFLSGSSDPVSAACPQLRSSTEGSPVGHNSLPQPQGHPGCLRSLSPVCTSEEALGNATNPRRNEGSQAFSRFVLQGKMCVSSAHKSCWFSFVKYSQHSAGLREVRGALLVKEKRKIQ